MKITDLLKNKVARERNIIKIKALKKIKPFKFRKGDLDIDIQEINQEDNRLKLIVQAKKDGIDLFIDNPLYFVNPPILVPDGTTRSVSDGMGNARQISNFKEDLTEALKQMVVEVIRITT